MSVLPAYLMRFGAVAAIGLSLGGCQNLSSLIAANPTVVTVVDGIRAGCGWEANSSDVQALLNSGIPGLKTIDNFVGAFCSQVAALPVAAARMGASGPMAVPVAGVPIRAQRIVK